MNTRATLTEIYDSMIIDAKYKPSFLDMRKQLDKDIRDAISSIIIELTDCIKPYVITDKQAIDIYVNYEFEWECIELICRDLIQYFKLEHYINGLIEKWINTTLELEEYESSENLTKVKKLITNRTILKNQI